MRLISCRNKLRTVSVDRLVGQYAGLMLFIWMSSSPAGKKGYELQVFSMEVVHPAFPKLCRNFEFEKYRLELIIAELNDRGKISQRR